MPKPKNPKYSDAFKREVVAFVLQDGVSFGQASRKYGPSITTIRDWVSKKAPARRHEETKSKRGGATRDANGHFRKGVSGNPSGNTTAVEQAKRAAQDAALEALQSLLEIMRISTERFKSSDEGYGGTLALQSIREVLDRGIGKPAQVQEIIQTTKITLEDFDAVRSLADDKLAKFNAALESRRGGGADDDDSDDAGDAR